MHTLRQLVSLAALAALAIGSATTGDGLGWQESQPRILAILEPEDSVGILLGSVADVAHGEDGRFYFAVASERGCIVAIPADGSKHQVLGCGTRDGREFEPRRIGWLGRSLWVLSIDGRIAFYGNGGDEGRPVEHLPKGTNQTVIHAVLRDSSLLLVPRFDSRAVLLGQHARAPLVAHRQRLRHDTLATLEFGNAVLAVDSESGGLTTTGQPFGDTPLVAVDRSGSYIAVAERRTHDSNDTWYLTVINHQGDTLARTGHSYIPIRLTPARIDSVLTIIVGRLETGARLLGLSAAELRAAARKELYNPGFLPPVTALLVTAEGSAWVRREENGEAVVRWEHHALGEPRIRTLYTPRSFQAVDGDGAGLTGFLRQETPPARTTVVRFTVSVAAPAGQ